MNSHRSYNLPFFLTCTCFDWGVNVFNLDLLILLVFPLNAVASLSNPCPCHMLKTSFTLCFMTLLIFLAEFKLALSSMENILIIALINKNPFRFTTFFYAKK